LIQKKHFNTTAYYLLLIIAFGIGTQTVLYKVGIIFLLFLWLFSSSLKETINELRLNKQIVSLILVYALYVVSFLWSTDISFAYKDLLLKSPLLLFPLIFSSIRLSKIQFLNVILIFVIASFLINLASIINSFFIFLHTNDLNSFYYQQLTINIHSAYQATITCFSICCIIYLKHKGFKINDLIFYFFVFFQALIILLLSSRMQILIMAIIAPVFIISRYSMSRQFFKGLIYSLIVLLSSYLFINIPSSSLKFRYAQSKKTVSNIALDVKYKHTEPRGLIWRHGIEVIKDNFFIGTGVGDAKNELVKKYKKEIIKKDNIVPAIDSISNAIKKDPNALRYLANNNTYKEIKQQENKIKEFAKRILKRNNYVYTNFSKKKYNFHNQFLQTFATIGLTGFLLLMYFIFSTAHRAFYVRDYLSLAFIFIISFSLVTESMLERHAGVSFFSFFAFFLTMLNPKSLYKSF